MDLAWDNRLTKRNNRVHERFAQIGSSFDIDGVNLNNNSIDYALTVSSLIYDNLRVYVEGSGESWNKANVYNVLAGVEFCW